MTIVMRCGLGMVVWGRMCGNIDMGESLDHCFDVYNSIPGLAALTVCVCEFLVRQAVFIRVIDVGRNC